MPERNQKLFNESLKYLTDHYSRSLTGDKITPNERIGEILYRLCSCCGCVEVNTPTYRHYSTGLREYRATWDEELCIVVGFVGKEELPKLPPERMFVRIPSVEKDFLISWGDV